jgi:hypothetical protein
MATWPHCFWNHVCSGQPSWQEMCKEKCLISRQAGDRE